MESEQESEDFAFSTFYFSVSLFVVFQFSFANKSLGAVITGVFNLIVGILDMVK